MPLPDTTYAALIISAIKEETPGVKTFTLVNADGSTPAYAAGQFITLVFTHHGREERRSFSISSSAALQEPLSVTIKRVDNGAYSRLLNDRASVGDQLFTTGAAGLFTLPQQMQPCQVFFFAAGIGITPIYSLLKTMLHTTADVHAVLVYSNRSRVEVVFHTELNDLIKKFPERLKIEYLYSNSFNLSRARLNKELIPVLLREYGTVPKPEMLCYICGPYDYMRMVTWTLEEQGIDSAQIRKENFNTNGQPVFRMEPPDKVTRQVTINQKGHAITITCAYPDTLLQAAKKNNISLPYSCETGKCGSCAALCTSGEVWLSYNEVLTDADLKAGRILTCTGHPVNGDVTIAV